MKYNDLTIDDTICLLRNCHRRLGCDVGEGCFDIGKPPKFFECTVFCQQDGIQVPVLDVV